MLIDLLSTSNLVSFNIKIAQKLGLHTAIYLQELLNINDKAIRKKKVTDDYFVVDRKYLTERTTLPEAEQKEIEKCLASLGILQKSADNLNSMQLNVTSLTTILMSEDESLMNDVSKIVKSKANKKTKDEVIKETLRSAIVSNNPELRDAYSDWIDSVYARQGWMSKKSVTAAQALVDEVSNRDLDVALKILEIAAVNGYRDMQWAVNTYKDNFKVSYKIQQPTKSRAQLSNEVF